MRRLGLRLRLFVVVVAAVAVVLAALVAVFNVVLDRELQRGARDIARSRALAELGALHTVRGRLVRGTGPDDLRGDAYVWTFSGARAVERPAASPALQRAVAALAGGPARFMDVAPTDTRLYALPVRLHGREVGTVVAGVSLAPYETTRTTALVSSLVFGGVVLLLVGIAARWLLASSLRPVVRLTRQAAVWSEHDDEHRFALGPPHDELTELAATLDGLLDRLAASLRHERRFSAELSHELRTPLARILAESELALRRERTPSEYRKALEVVHRGTAQVARIVDALVAAARHEAGGGRATADAVEVALGAVAACEGVALERDIDVAVDRPPQPVRIGVERDLAERILQPVVENACRYSAHRVHVRVERDRAGVRFAVDDDGSGVRADERERIFDPGVRGAVSLRDGGSGAGLGLALARRLARSVDGEVDAEASTEGGRFTVRLPSG